MNAFAGLGYKSIDEEQELSELLLETSSNQITKQTVVTMTTDSIFSYSEVN